jgi:hypothetical protein
VKDRHTVCLRKSGLADSQTHKTAVSEKHPLLWLRAQILLPGRKIPDETLPLIAQIKAEKEMLGYISLVDTSRQNTAVVTDINTKYSTLRVQLYCLGNGVTTTVKLKKQQYQSMPLTVGDVVNFRTEVKAGWTRDSAGQWQIDKTKSDVWLKSYTIEQ